MEQNVCITLSSILILMTKAYLLLQEKLEAYNNSENVKVQNVTNKSKEEVYRKDVSEKKGTYINFVLCNLILDNICFTIFSLFIYWLIYMFRNSVLCFSKLITDVDKTFLKYFNDHHYFHCCYFKTHTHTKSTILFDFIGFWFPDAHNFHYFITYPQSLPYKYS